MEKNKRIISILSIFTIIFTLMGGTLAYWTWTSTEITGVAFTIDKDFSCSADGGQDLNATNIELQPTADCTNPDYALQRTIKVTPDIKKEGLSINLNMWLKVNNIGPGLAASDNFMYAISTVEGSCKEGMEGYINSGNFKGTTVGSQVELLKDKTYSATTTDTYYLYIWLDAAETNIATANQSFDLSLGGVCTDNPYPSPEEPVLDDGMIPVTIANDGTVTIVSESDPSWYDYNNKEWANVVLVEENATSGVENSHPRSYYQDIANIGQEVTQEDILAYYVWIPRYKYKMPQEQVQVQLKCSDKENPTKEEYPECYGYTLKNTDESYVDALIDTLANHLIPWHCHWNEDGTDFECTDEEWDNAMSDAELVLDEMLRTGSAYCSEDDQGETYCEIQIDDFIDKDEYNVTFYEDRDLGEEIIPGSIDIVFESKEEEFENGDAITEYRTHKSFSGYTAYSNLYETDIELEHLAGIWVGKFESNPEKNSVCYNTPSSTNCNNGTQNPTILPNKRSLIYQDLTAQFGTSKNISEEGNIYGLDNETINAHMMKNGDWGAVLYLSHSQYGIDGNIKRNNYSGLTTGCGFGSDNTKCTNGYGTVEAYPQSTTGNISGIFDMAGGTWEDVMGIRIDEYEDWKEFGSTGYYYDFNNISSIKGNAMGETVSWYGNYDEFSNSDWLWVVHGGDYSTVPSGAFHAAGKDYEYNTFDKSDKITWRSVLRPGHPDFIMPEE